MEKNNQEVVIFKIIFGGKVEEYSGKEEDLLSIPLTQFANSKNKELEDFNFYYEESKINYDNNITIKDSIFGNKEVKIFKISAVLKEKCEELKNEIIEKKNEIKNEIKINLIEQDEIKEINEKNKKEIIYDYYEDIICPMCLTTAIIDKESDDDLSLNILNCENFHFLKNIKFDIYDDYVFDRTKKDLIEKNKELFMCDICKEQKYNMSPPEDELYICS